MYRPSQMFIFWGHIIELDLGKIMKHKDSTDSKIFICYSSTKDLAPENMFPICCRISHYQPIAHLVLNDVTFPNTTKPCAITISQRNFHLVLNQVSLPTHFMVELMEIWDTSLVGVKSFNLTNKAASLRKFNLNSVDMDQELCESLLKQIPYLIKLVTLHIIPYKYRHLMKSCHMPRNMCSEFLRSITYFSHISNLDFSGNNLEGCLSNFLSDSESSMPRLTWLSLQDTAMNKDDINHISHIIETGKLPHLVDLNFDENDFRGMDNEI